MSNFPVRNLAERGICPDVPSWDLPPNAFSIGSNVRFKDGRVSRSPVFRTLRSSELTGSPQTVVGYRPSTGFDLVFVGYQNGAITDQFGVDMTPEDRELLSDQRPWTTTLQGDVLYMNRPSHVPAVLLPQATQFIDLPNWATNQRCRSLRACKDFLFAVNLTKGTDFFPTTIAWSDVALFGQVPGTWDASDLSGLANELPIPKLESPLVDLLPLGDHLMVYSESNVIRFEYTGDTSDSGQNLWVNRPLFQNCGLINPNCIAEYDGRHFVFGVDDLYVHDGVSRQSIGANKVRRWVFHNMNLRFADRNFVMHIPKTNEVLYAFVSGDQDAYFQEPTGCNKGALYDVERDVWSLVDLPNVTAATLANVDPTLTWDTCPDDRHWDNIGGSWYDLRDGFVRHTVFAAYPLATSGLPDPALYAFDEMDTGQLAYPMKPEANPPAFVERIGLDLDDIGADLISYKTLRRVLPQITTYRHVPVRFRIGHSSTPQGNYTWGDWLTFDPHTDYKVDARANGRYVAIRMEVPQPCDFDFSGFDFDVVLAGKR